MIYTAVIIDDEAKLREVLKIKVDRFCKDLTVVAQADSAQSGFEAIVQHEPDIVFLDISMPGGTGFDMLDKFDDFSFEIIFITGYDEYALEAFRVNAVDYILKPVRTEELVTAVNRALERIKNKNALTGEYAFNRKDYPRKSKVAIPSDNEYHLVKVEQIILCKGWQRYSKVQLVNKEEIISSYPLGYFKLMLEKYGFIQVHKSYLVNKEHVVRYLKEGTVIMSDGTTVPVARRRRNEFLSHFG